VPHVTQHVTLGGTHGLSWRLQTALVERGWRVAAGTGRFRILAGSGVPLRNVEVERDFLLRGGRLLLLGGEGPLLARLHLSPEQKTVVEGESESFHAAFPAVPIRRTQAITGVGYAFLRIGQDAVVLGGSRGEGWFVHCAEIDPDPALFLAALDWLADPRW